MCAFQAGIIFFEICSCSELNDDMSLEEHCLEINVILV